MGAAKGKQSDTEALCHPPPPLPMHLWPGGGGGAGEGGGGLSCGPMGGGGQDKARGCCGGLGF